MIPIRVIIGTCSGIPDIKQKKKHKTKIRFRRGRARPLRTPEDRHDFEGAVIDSLTRKPFNLLPTDIESVTASDEGESFETEVSKAELLVPDKTLDNFFQHEHRARDLRVGKARRAEGKFRRTFTLLGRLSRRIGNLEFQHTAGKRVARCGPADCAALDCNRCRIHRQPDCSCYARCFFEAEAL